MDPHPHLLASVAHLSNTALLARVKRLAARERHTTAILIVHLAELDERRLYLAEGYSSLFIYCTQGLHFSEHAAYNRIEAARVARKFPVLLARLADGSVTLTTIRLLAPHLTPENHQDLLEKARYQSKRAVEELVAQLYPLPPVPATIRRLPARRHRRIVRTAIEVAQACVKNGVESREDMTIAPLGAERFKIQFTASAETHAKLRRAQALLRHQVPDGDVATIIDRALTALVEQVAKQKVAATDRPRRMSKDSEVRGSRHIQNAVKRAVWARDGGRCAFVSKAGRRCSEDGFLEFHHLTPYAAGGGSNAENIELRCHAHNGYEAELYFGPGALPVAKETRAAYSIRPESSQLGESRATYLAPVNSSILQLARAANSFRGEF